MYYSKNGHFLYWAESKDKEKLKITIERRRGQDPRLVTVLRRCNIYPPIPDLVACSLSHLYKLQCKAMIQDSPTLTLSIFGTKSQSFSIRSDSKKKANELRLI